MDESGLHQYLQVFDVNIKYLVHPAHIQHDTALQGYGTSGKASTCAPGSDRYAVTVGQFDYFRYFCCGAGHDHIVRCTGYV